jgi:hypothetical protein
MKIRSLKLESPNIAEPPTPPRGVEDFKKMVTGVGETGRVGNGESRTPVAEERPMEKHSIAAFSFRQNAAQIRAEAESTDDVQIRDLLMAVAAEYDGVARYHGHLAQISNFD